MELVSVIMPTYNTPYEYLNSAVKSILKQTYEEIEVIIVDDASTDYNDSNKILKIIGDDPRVRLIKNVRTKGVAGALNTGILYSKGKYIIRMDADDIAIDTRIEQQIRYMEQYPEISILAGYTKDFGASKKVFKSCIRNEDIKTILLFHSAISHPSVCIRKSVFDEFGYLYDENIQSEDYDLWTRCAVNKAIKFATLPKIILYYRIHENQVTKKRISIMQHQGKLIRINYLKSLGVLLREEEYGIFADYNMLIKKKYSIKHLLQIQNSIIEQILKTDVNEKRRIEHIYRLSCMKKAIVHILNKDIKQIMVLMYHLFRCKF